VNGGTTETSQKETGMPKKLALIVAVSANDVIGADGGMPWHLSADLKRFKRLTMGHCIIMGRKTYESIGRLLPGRTTVIVSRQAAFHVNGARVANSFEEALERAGDDDCPFVTGGAQIYELALPRVTDIYLTRIHKDVLGDTWLPEIAWEQWELADSETHDNVGLYEYSFEHYCRS
jgi:dihydrofolate reductase